MEQFLAEIEAYAAACGLKPTTVVQRAGRLGGATWAKWQAGASCSMRIAERIRRYIADNPAPVAAVAADPKADAA